ncbi:MAG TPA: response regulator [Gemmatimonadales bacterium]|nr:response regulator [Gemmatimonadales bacterium]
MPETILIVEDNLLTRSVVSATLARRGYQVLEAPDGQTALDLLMRHRPALVLQDLHLPDLDGVDLVARMRKLPMGDGIPIIAFSGLMSRLEEARAMCAGFTDYLFKPIEPGRLVEVVDAFLAPRRLLADRPGRGRLLLLVSDDPVQSRLDAQQFQDLGFAVETARNGAAALEAARTTVPAVVLADLLLPGMTGMELCLALRRDPLLSVVPTIIASSAAAFADGEEQRLAEQIGASALVVRNPGLGEVVNAVLAALASPHVPMPTADADALNTAYMARLIRQLEHQTAINRKLTRRAAMDAALLSIMTRAAQVLTRDLDLPRLLEDVLGRALDAGGVSAGAVYLLDEIGTPVMRSQIGVPREALREMREFHGFLPLLRELCHAEGPTQIPSDGISEGTAATLLSHTQSAAIIVAPLRAGGMSQGALVMLSRSRDHGDGWLASIGAVASQLGQAVTLSRTAEQLKLSEERHRSLFEGMPTGLFRSSPDGKLLDGNLELQRLYGAPDRETLLGTPADRFYFEAEDREKWQTAMAEHGELHDYEMRLQRLDGTPVWVSVTARLIRGPDSQVLSYEGSVIDISQRRALESQLLQSQKMEAIGQLAAGVAHDFNNMLTVISGYAELLREDVADSVDQTESVQQILQAAERAGTLTRQLLAFGRRQVLQPVALDLNKALAAVEKMIGRLIGEDIELYSALDPAVVPVTLDPGQLEQVLFNLAANARDAMPRGGKLTFETQFAVLDQAAAAVRGLSTAGPYVVLGVTDNGVGMSRDVQGHIFEPFFTTKPRGKGTGLGLATVYGIVRQSGGNILVYSEAGAGTSFKLYFPATPEAAAGIVPAAPVAVPAPMPSACILLAEDEDAVRRLVADVLRHQGHHVLIARNAEEATRLAATTERPIDLLLTDVIMPGLSGPDLSQRLMHDLPGLRVLFMSGYAGEAIVRHGALPAGAAFLDKPFSGPALIERVNQMLMTPR